MFFNDDFIARKEAIERELENSHNDGALEKRMRSCIARLPGNSVEEMLARGYLPSKEDLAAMIIKQDLWSPGVNDAKVSAAGDAAGSSNVSPYLFGPFVFDDERSAFAGAYAEAEATLTECDFDE